MLNIAICDDDIRLTSQMEGLVNQIANNYSIDKEVEIFWDGQELVRFIKDGLRFDIIFLDIEMTKMNGISTAKEIRKIDSNVFIVYVTSHENYMKESFDVRPYRFLVKPVSVQEFTKCFLQAFKELTWEDYYFRYRYQKMNYKIAVKDILYFESQKRKVKIVTLYGSYETYGKLSEVQKYMDQGKVIFFRVHQSYLVNYMHIKKLAYSYIVMDDGQEVPISEDRRKSIAKQYCGLGDIFDNGN